ncbi:MAG: peptidoglycan DD-metalloendopeptidase family protein [Anaerolineae bacterium]|nr:peptidoglycan DD-metalloendopeptidase family protein [Anaerolineae bacterium]
MRRLFVVLLVLLLLPTAARTQQPAPFCGVVDSLDFPIPNLVAGYDDFGLYRARFGGNHVGLDIGFDRWGEPVHAAARGRVTLSNIEEWDTEKGVVIVEHTFPDGSIYYTLYGHMEETDTYKFPTVGQCVDQDSVLGGIGWPSRGRPHLHYEVRNFMPEEGGPGYVTTNPLDEGWYNPLDFTALWHLRLSPGFVESTTFHAVPALPPVVLDSGLYAIASGNVLLIGDRQNGQALWHVETDGVMTGIAGLPGDRVVAHTRNGQVLILENGRYSALWTVEGLDEPFLMLGETLVFVLPGGGVEAHDAAGTLLWSLPAVTTSGRVTQFAGSGQQFALGVRTDSGDVLWRLINTAGQIQFEGTFDQQPVVAPAWDGSWVGLDGAQFKRFVDGENHTYGSIGTVPGRTAVVTADVLGNSYVYLGDSGNTLMALDPTGRVLWRTPYPLPAAALSPLMDTGSGCVLYTLDSGGSLNLFDASSGELINQVEIYAGGERNSSPRARVLEVDQNERIHVGSGFLSLVTLDGWALGGPAMNNCLLG